MSGWPKQTGPYTEMGAKLFERRVDMAKFIRIWQFSNSAAETARACGIKYNMAKRYAQYLREKGVPLKKYKGGPVPNSLNGKFLRARWLLKNVPPPLPRKIKVQIEDRLEEIISLLYDVAILKFKPPSYKS